MRFSALCLLLLLSCACLTLAQVSYDDCCLKYVRQLSPKGQKRAVDYKHQLADGGCNIPAVIFIMKSGRKICASPKDRWATDLMLTIDAKKARQIQRERESQGASERRQPQSRRG